MAFAETFKALSDPVRREILQLLKNGKMSAGEIGGHFDMTGATISYHLILSRLVDTFFSRISLTMPPAPKSHNTAYVLPWEEPLQWQSRSSGYSSS